MTSGVVNGAFKNTYIHEIMFDVTGNHIAILGDEDLRELVRKLAVAELRSQGCPVSSVIAGGNQDAPDVMIDLRIECPIPLPKPDFTQSSTTRLMNSVKSV